MFIFQPEARAIFQPSSSRVRQFIEHRLPASEHLFYQIRP